MTIGRGQDCGIVIEDQTVSRLHAEVFAQGPGYAVRNLSRTNPVLLEHYGSVVRLEWGQHAPLQPGTRLRLGQAEIAASQPLSLRVRCPGPCGRVVEVPPSGFCPHCGTALATADTYH